VQFVPSDLFEFLYEIHTEEELKKIRRAIGTLHHLLIYFRQLRHAKSDVAASIGLFVSMVCLVLLLAKLIKSIALSVGIQPQKI
jgi:ABC-type polysaccharide transport system permease subunit